MNKGNERHSMMNFLVLWIFSYILFIWQSINRIIVNIVISKLAQFQYNLRQNMSLSIKVDRILK